MLKECFKPASLATAACALFVGIGAPAQAISVAPGDVSVVSGFFASDSDVALHYVHLDAPTTTRVNFETFSYAGGVTDTGSVVPRGGFDPIVSVFRGNGDLVDYNDDGWRRFDAETGNGWDSFVSVNLEPGSYIAAVTQYDNFPDYAGGLASLAGGFLNDGLGNFTADYCGADSFCDVSGSSRTPNYTLQVAPVPVPAALPLMLGGMALLGAVRLRRKTA